MSEPSSSDSSEEQIEAMRPGESEITIQSSSRKYMETSEGLPLAVSTLEPSLKDVAQELQDVVPSSRNAVQQNLIRIDVQQNVTMKGTANMTFGGTQNVSTLPPAYHNLLQRTISKLDKWTKGIVETAALEKVMEKINKGVSWVTIKGCPGEGKTTTARMALNELHKAGRKIFDVTTPEEFRTIITTCQDHPVVMLDDVFGNLEFDKTEWSKWKPILLKTLDDHQQYSEDNVESSASGSSGKELDEKMDVPKHDVTVILVGRQYVLDVCVSDLGKVADFFTHEKHVVNMSNPEQRDFEEKFRLWKAISFSSQVKLDDDTIRKICTINIPHGFPHVCKLFVTLRKKNPDLSAELFFEKPLEFLNETIAKLIQNKEKCDLFKAMLEKGGKITAREIEDHKEQDMIDVATDLVGTYLREEDDCFMFDHPSVYDSVAYKMCTRATSFVIQNCEMNFIHERIRLRKGNDIKTDSHLVVSISRDYIPELATRFAKEISEGKFSQSLCHQAFTDAEFVAKTMSLVTVDLNELVALPDQQMKMPHSFWTLISSNGSPELLKYVEKQRIISREEYGLVLYGVCFFAATDVLCYMVENMFFNINNFLIVDYFHRESAAMIAAKGRNKSFVDKIMTLNPNVHARNSGGQTLLHVLVQNGLTEAVERAIEKGADVNSNDQRRFTPLIYACQGGHDNIVQILIERGACVDVEDHDLHSPLFYACQDGNDTIVQLLIKAGASIHRLEFAAACESGNVKLVKLLVLSGYKFSNSNDFDYLCPLMSAVQSRNVKMVEFLIKSGISVNDKQSLHCACQHGLTEIAKVLLENGSDINAKNRNGDTPLHAASSEECFSLILTFKPKLFEKDNYGNTVLHTASEKGLKKAVSTLIREKLDVEAKNNSLQTPLFRASDSGSTDCVKFLIDSGADVNAKDISGNTPLHRFGNLECARLLVNAGASVNIRNKQNQSPFSLAFLLNAVDNKMVDFFIQKKADVNVRVHNEDTPLHSAARSRLYQVIPKLLEAGANPQFTNIDGETPLHSAVRTIWDTTSCVSIIRELIRHGADVNSQDVRGNVPLHYLQGIGDRVDAIKNILMKSGADVNITNFSNQPALYQIRNKFKC